MPDLSRALTRSLSRARRLARALSRRVSSRVRPAPHVRPTVPARPTRVRLAAVGLRARYRSGAPVLAVQTCPRSRGVLRTMPDPGTVGRSRWPGRTTCTATRVPAPYAVGQPRARHGLTRSRARDDWSGCAPGQSGAGTAWANRTRGGNNGTEHEAWGQATPGQGQLEGSSSSSASSPQTAPTPSRRIMARPAVARPRSAATEAPGIIEA